MSKDKMDQGKVQPTLVYRSLVEAVARVREHGAKKYGGTESWQKVASSRYIDALLRHVLAFAGGEELDAESGMHHLWHAATNIMFEIERRERYRVLGLKQSNILVEMTCLRCHAKDSYPLVGVFPCTSRCGYFIEPLIKV